MTYIGRFAPSPTGPLHFGSLIAALGSWLDARANNGQWLLRIEDLDPPRAMSGAEDLIIKSLERHELFWDGEISYQSQRLRLYDKALDELAAKGMTYACYCSRREIRENGGLHIRCNSENKNNDNVVFARRLKVDDINPAFTDCFQGNVQTEPQQASEDFILKRKDGLHAYMLAVVVDDIEQGVNHIIRGSDLLTTTCQQIYLFQQLNAAPPIFGHLPLATRANGDKLSKQNHAPAIDDKNPKHNLCQALMFLGQPLPDNHHDLSISTLLDHAVAHWQPELFNGQQSSVVTQEYSH